jgi:Transposase domain (DUF772)
MSRSRDLQLGFADLEFLRQGIVLERELQAITDFLDEHEEMVEAVGADLRRGLKNAKTGRKGLTPQQVLRSLILMRVKNWDYRELRERIADGLTLRLFTDFNARPVPKHDAFQRAFNRVTPQTLRLVNELLITTAEAMGLEDGRKLRVDTTVVQTDILRAAARKMSNAEHIVMRSPECGTPQLGPCNDISLRITVATERREQRIRRLEAARPQFRRQHRLQSFQLHRWISPCINLRRLHVCMTEPQRHLSKVFRRFQHR